MEWIVFSYSLPSNSSTPRVALWRRLRRLGAVTPTGSAYVLPALDECVEAFQWLAQETQQAGGEVLVMRVTQFDGLPDARLVEQFNQARAEEYEALAGQIATLAQSVAGNNEPDSWRDALAKLQRQQMEIARVDYFQSPPGATVAGQLNQLAHQLLQPGENVSQIQQLSLADFQGRRWVTRPRPHVDRLACIWLIRRYVAATAVIHYTSQPEPDDIPFDMSAGTFSHQGNFCTFEVMLQTFGLEEPALAAMAEIVHEIDLRDGRFQRPETSGIDAILRGWLLAGLSDLELEASGKTLFDGLYATLSSQPPV
jgi:hypothetical protein